MVTPVLPSGPAPYDSDPDIEAFLEKYDLDVLAQARLQVPRKFGSHEALSDLIDELAQRTRIKLCDAWHKREITNPKAYIRRIAYTEAIEMIRQYRLIRSFTLEENREFEQEYLLISSGREVEDPSVLLEEQETLAEYLTQIVEALLSLPFCQQRGMICWFKDKMEDPLLLIKAFDRRGVDIRTINWPEDRYEKQKLQSSVSVARKKLQPLLRKLTRP